MFFMSNKQQKQYLNIWLSGESFQHLDTLKLENPEKSKVQIVHEKILDTQIPERAFGIQAMEIVKLLKENFESQIAIIKGRKKPKPEKRRELLEKIKNDAENVKDKLEQLFPLYKNIS